MVRMVNDRFYAKNNICQKRGNRKRTLKLRSKQRIRYLEEYSIYVHKKMCVYACEIHIIHAYIHICKRYILKVEKTDQK